MVYNRPETIYYKAAKKLLHAGLKITNADKLRATPQLLPLISQISLEELGCDDHSSAALSEDEESKLRPEVSTLVESQNIKSEPNDEMTIDETVIKVLHEWVSFSS